MATCNAIPEQVYEPFGCNPLAFRQILAAIALVTAFVLPAYLCFPEPCGHLALAFWLALGAVQLVFIAWFRAYRRKTFLEGDCATGTIVKKAPRRGYGVLVIDTLVNGTPRRLSVSVGLGNYMSHQNGSIVALHIRSIQVLNHLLGVAAVLVPLES
jgi:hypothetical protein